MSADSEEIKLVKVRMADGGVLLVPFAQVNEIGYAMETGKRVTVEVYWLDGIRHHPSILNGHRISRIDLPEK